MIHDDQIFVLGGGTASDVDEFDFIWGFNISNKSWNRYRTYPDTTIPLDDGIADLYPKGRKCHSVVQDGKCKFLANTQILRTYFGKITGRNRNRYYQIN